jgi:hypothetical protein
VRYSVSTASQWLCDRTRGFLAGIASDAGANASSGGEFSVVGSHTRGLGNSAEFRLDPEVAEAALGTPSTSSSSRGAEWVRLTVNEDNPHDYDRARAWFLSAWRKAGG